MLLGHTSAPAAEDPRSATKDPRSAMAATKLLLSEPGTGLDPDWQTQGSCKRAE